jgi:ATP-dependent phosphoenolpyruvate carboxykinase
MKRKKRFWRTTFSLPPCCVASTVHRLSRESDPEIYECTRRFGTVLENVSGVKEPTATFNACFNACFGAPFMVRHPSVYA